MGDPKRIRKKYDTPGHPWIKARIDDERRIKREFGTKNKKEIWKMETKLKNFKSQAKKLIALDTEQSQKETEHLFRRVKELGLASEHVSYDVVLGLSLDDLMQRRLQSIVVKKELASSAKQARQFITHEHIAVNGKVISSPSYLVSVAEEGSVNYASNSPLFGESHPERPQNAKKQVDVTTQTALPEKAEPKAEEAKVEETPAAEEAPAKEAEPVKEAEEAPKEEAKEAATEEPKAEKATPEESAEEKQ